MMATRDTFDAGPYAEWLGLSTGLISGGELNVNVSNSSAVDIGALVGYIVDYTSNELNPRITRVSLPSQTVPLEDITRPNTWWMVDINGNVIQQATRPTNTQRRSFIQLGATAQQGGVIFIDQSLPVVSRELTNQFYDFLYAVGPFHISGNVIAAAGANLQLTQTSGKVFQVSQNRFQGPVLTNDPHVSTTLAQNPVAFRYATRDTTVTPNTVTTLDPTKYDLNGVATIIGGGVVVATIQHVYLFATNTVEDQIVIQYGQTVYPTLDDALIAVGNELFTRNANLQDSIYLYSIIMTRTATNLQDPTQARIIKMPLFAHD